MSLSVSFCAFAFARRARGRDARFCAFAFARRARGRDAQVLHTVKYLTDPVLHLVKYLTYYQR